MPEGIVPVLASTGALPAAGESWAYEFKWDGVRAIAYSQPGRLRLESRNLNDITGRYPELAGLNGAPRGGGQGASGGAGGKGGCRPGGALNDGYPSG